MRKRRRKLKKGLGYTISRICILLAVPLLMVGAVFGIVSLVKNSGAIFGGGKFTQMPFTANDVYAFTSNSYIYIKDGILYYDDITNDSKDASYKINTPELEIAASSAICALYNQTTVQIVGASSAIEGHGTIEKVKCGLDYIAVLLKDEIGTVFLKVFDKNAAVVDEIRPESDNSFIMDFGFTDTDTNTLWTLLADTSSEITVSTITTYDLSKKSTTGVMTVQNQLVESLNFTDNSIFAVGTNDLMRYNNGNLIYRLPVYGYELLDFSASPSKCVFLFESRSASDTRSTLKLYTALEKEDASCSTVTIQLPYNTITALLVNGKIVSCSPDKIYTYSYSGTLLSETELDFVITSPGAVKVNDSEILLFSSPSLYRYKVK